MNNNSATPLSAIVIICVSACLAATAYIVASMLPILLELPKRNDLFEISTGIISILFGIGFTFFALMKTRGKAGFGKLFLSGWMTTLFMSLLISIFYIIAIHQKWIVLQEGENISAIIPVVILKYNALGLMLSSVLALIFRRE
ncbi:MAG: hypothetical protein M9887_09490 [Chitinophagales bacterium]|nr:hypothetical protein [Chitinophagales bacterium]